jgi:hypothetical protein
MNSLFHLGPEKEGLLAARKSILDILNADADESTKQKALEAFVSVGSVNHSVIQNCNFTANPDKPKAK